MIATDGLWEFVSSDEVAGAVMLTHAEAQEESANDHLARALQELKAESASRWVEREGCVDDTAIVLAEIATVTSTVMNGSGDTRQQQDHQKEQEHQEHTADNGGIESQG